METMGAGQLEGTARRVARLGPRGLTGMPVETVGAWSSVDRAEIENMRSMRGIMAEYVDAYRAGRRVKRPLSVAVFGPPGAGKSFAVKQVATALLPGQLRGDRVQPLAVLRRAASSRRPSTRPATPTLRSSCRSCSGTSSTPPWRGVPLGWLRHFLAPMQDGEFVEGEARIRSARRSSCSPEAPRPRSPSSPPATTQAPATPRSPTSSAGCAAPWTCWGPTRPGPPTPPSSCGGPCCCTPSCGQSVPHLFTGGRLNIDEGVLRAFLHGTLPPRGALYGGDRRHERAHGQGELRAREPAGAPSQLTLHVDAEAFLALVAAEQDLV